MERLEERLEEVFQTIPESALARKINAEEKLQTIVQEMDEYKQDIRELVQKITPTTPPEFRKKRRKKGNRTSRSSCTRI
jgi:predicted  nucleic acid-binding Zn-ribbon protein